MQQFIRRSEPAGLPALAAVSLAFIGCALTDDYAIRSDGGSGGGDGGVAVAAGAGPGTGASTNSTGVAGADPCGPSSPAVGGVCPDVCTSCTGSTCTVTCTDCEDTTIDCPAGFVCNVNCSSNGSCEGLMVNCAADSDCNLACSGEQSCKDAQIGCHAGACNVVCGEKACKSAVFDCGLHGACSCSAEDSKPAMKGCESACSCDGCN